MTCSLWRKTKQSAPSSVRCSEDWFVYAKPPFGGPLHVFHYLARYTHRVAISNHRLIAFIDGKVTFRWKDYAHGSKQRLMTLTAEEFLRQFLLHTLPRGLVRIRFFGFLASPSVERYCPYVSNGWRPTQHRVPTRQHRPRLVRQTPGLVRTAAARRC